MAKKKQIINITSPSQAVNIMRDLKDVTIKLTRLKNRADEQIKKIQTALVDATADLDAKDSLLRKSLEVYVEENEDTILADSRTVDTPYGSFGLRNNPPKVELTMKKTEDAIAAIRRMGKKFTAFIREKWEIDKNAVKSAYDRKDVTDRDLAKCGLAVTQTDTFFVNIDLQELGDKL